MSSRLMFQLTPWASEWPDAKNYTWRLNLVWHRMLYSCIHMATVGVKGLNANGRRQWWLTAACPDGWCIMMREFGSECLMPGLPAVSSSEAMLAAWPTHHVATGGNTYCIVSYMPRPAVTEPPEITHNMSYVSVQLLLVSRYPFDSVAGRRSR